MTNVVMALLLWFVVTIGVALLTLPDDVTPTIICLSVLTICGCTIEILKELGGNQ